jgi:hypothetical protein
MREPAELADLRRVLSRRYQARGPFQTQVTQASAFLTPSQAAKLQFLGTMHERLTRNENDTISLGEFRAACAALVQSLGPVPRTKVWNVTGPMVLGMFLFGFSFVFLKDKPFLLSVLPFFPISTLWLAGIDTVRSRHLVGALAGLVALGIVYVVAPPVGVLFIAGLLLFEVGLARSPFWFVKAVLVVVAVGTSLFAVQHLGLLAVVVVLTQPLLLFLAFRKPVFVTKFLNAH